MCLEPNTKRNGVDMNVVVRWGKRGVLVGVECSEAVKALLPEKKAPFFQVAKLSSGEKRCHKPCKVLYNKNSRIL